jgi:hypothetical protein
VGGGPRRARRTNPSDPREGRGAWSTGGRIYVRAPCYGPEPASIAGATRFVWDRHGIVPDATAAGKAARACRNARNARCATSSARNGDRQGGRHRRGGCGRSETPNGQRRHDHRSVTWDLSSQTGFRHAGHHAGHGDNACAGCACTVAVIVNGGADRDVQSGTRARRGQRQGARA